MVNVIIALAALPGDKPEHLKSFAQALMSRVFAECQEAGLPEVAWFCLSENSSVPWRDCRWVSWVRWCSAAWFTQAMSFYGGLGFTPSAATAPQRLQIIVLHPWFVLASFLWPTRCHNPPNCKIFSPPSKVWNYSEMYDTTSWQEKKNIKLLTETDWQMRCNRWTFFCLHDHVPTMPTAALVSTSFPFLPNGNALICMVQVPRGCQWCMILTAGINPKTRSSAFGGSIAWNAWRHALLMWRQVIYKLP